MAERDDLAQSAARLAEALLGAPEFTRREVAAAAELDLAAVRKLWEALGFPPLGDDVKAFSRADLTALLLVRELVRERLGNEEIVVQQTRVLGQALARVADAQMGAVLFQAQAQRGVTVEDGASLAVVLTMLEHHVPRLEQFVQHILRRHLVAAALRLAAAPRAGDQPLAVGFADLAGFTALSASLDAAELGQMVDRFEAVAYHHIVGHGGRVVKTIGDEVMFAAAAPRVAAAIALDLTEAYARDPALPNARIGLAYGPVVPWEGDLFGPTVNLASRLVNFARPGTALVDEALGSALAGEAAIALRRLRPVRLKGVGAVRAWVLRRGQDPAGDAG